MNTSFNIKQIALATVAALGVSVAVGAYAGEPADGVPTRTVRYADLDLGTQAGVATLYNRIRLAAEEVCGGVGSPELARAAVAKACVDRAIAGAVHGVNNARLASVYDSHAVTVR